MDTLAFDATDNRITSPGCAHANKRVYKTARCLARIGYALRKKTLAHLIGYFVVALLLPLSAYSETVPSIPPPPTVQSSSIWLAPYGGLGSYPSGQAVCDTLNKSGSFDPPVYFLSDPGGVSGHCVQTNRWSPQGFNVFSVQSIYQHCPSGYGVPGLALAYPNANTVMCVNYSAPMQCPSSAAGETVFTLDAGGLTCSRCPVHARGTPCICDDGYKFDVAGTSCILVQYTISLTGGTTIEPGTGLGFTATVINQTNNQPPGNPVTVNISLKVDPTSGGHDHGDSTRPRGGIDGTACASDSTCRSFTTNGTVGFKFNAPEASGTHTITATCDRCANTATKMVEVKVPGLLPIPASPFYAFVGAVEGKHTRNHYLIPPAELALHQIASTYQWLDFRFRVGGVAPRPLHLNDASLVWGGKFDIYGKWKGDHKGHKRGVVVDIRANHINIKNGAIPLPMFEDFQEMALDHGAEAQVHCSDKKREAPTCIFNGTEDDGRHFHVLLLGVDQ